MRWSQAIPDARVGDNFWYAIMTAHGLGAFVGWAGFAVMGLAWWVLAAVGLPDAQGSASPWPARPGGSWCSASSGS